jgi:RIO-like serine/threonine protein kinase
MLVSWGGRSLDEVEVSEKAKVNREVVQSVRALHAHGVAYTDVRDANVLWDEETERAMVIDFEQAVLTERPRRTLAQQESTAYRCGRRHRRGQTKAEAHRLKIQDDILAGRMILC